MLGCRMNDSRGDWLDESEMEIKGRNKKENKMGSEEKERMRHPGLFDGIYTYIKYIYIRISI